MYVPRVDIQIMDFSEPVYVDISIYDLSKIIVCDHLDLGLYPVFAPFFR